MNRDAFFVATRDTPLSGAYAIAYAAAERLVVARLSRRKGVVAIYLLGGMLDAPIYGLSDLDFIVVVEGEDPFDDCRRIAEHYAFCRRVAPMLEAVERVGIFARSELAEAVAVSPLLQYRLAAPRRLLFGQDVLSEVPCPASRALQALGMIDDCWRRARDYWRTPPAHNYVYSKIVADLQRALVWAREGRFIASRKEALSASQDAAANAPFSTPPVNRAELLAMFERTLALDDARVSPIDADVFSLPVFSEERSHLPNRGHLRLRETPNAADAEQLFLFGARWRNVGCSAESY